MPQHDDIATPVSAGERIAFLDALRGFALLGILLMNIEGFVGPPDASMTGLDPHLTGADAWVDGAIAIFVQGKFYPLFSMLFGAGFVLFLERAEARGARAGLLFLRRAAGLLAIGVLHALYVWSGDILTTYALLAFVLLAFRGRAPEAQLATGIVLFCLPLLLWLLIGLSASNGASDGEFARTFAERIEQQRQAYGHGSFAEANAQRRADLDVTLGALPFLGPTVFGLFLIGASLLGAGLWRDPARHRPALRWLAALGFGLGLPLVLFAFRHMPTLDVGRVDLDAELSQIGSEIGALLLALGYAAAIGLGMSSARWRPRLGLLAPAGQMALTHYLLQSLICVGLFYGYGLGLFERLPRAWQLPFALLLWSAQVALSHWWLARFRFGPAEWLWRCLTYLRWQPFRRAR